MIQHLDFRSHLSDGELQLSFAGLTSKDIDRLIDFLRENEVTNLQLSSNKLGRAVIRLIEQIQTFNVQQLNLSHNQIPEADLPTVIKLIKRNFSLIHPVQIGELDWKNDLTGYSETLKSCADQNSGFHRMLSSKKQHPSLKFSFRNLKQVPSTLLQCGRLVKLNLGHNQLNEFPSELVQLPLLQVLFIDNNNIRSIPLSITKFPRLRSLDIHGNPIGELPVYLALLRNLHELNVSGCGLRTLPYTLGILPHIRTLLAKGNSFTNSTLSKCCSEDDKKGLIGFLKDNLKSEISTEVVIPLVILGNRGVGKSNIVEQLLKISSVSKVKHPARWELDGICETRLKFQLSKKKEVIFHVMEINLDPKLCLHNIFLNKNCIVLLVCDIEKSLVENGVHSWIHSIGNRISQQSMCVVGTHWDLVNYNKDKAMQFSNSIQMVTNKMIVFDSCVFVGNYDHSKIRKALLRILSGSSFSKKPFQNFNMASYGIAELLTAYRPMSPFTTYHHLNSMMCGSGLSSSGQKTKLLQWLQLTSTVLFVSSGTTINRSLTTLSQTDDLSTDTSEVDSHNESEPERRMSKAGSGADVKRSLRFSQPQLKTTDDLLILELKWLHSAIVVIAKNANNGLRVPHASSNAIEGMDSLHAHALKEDACLSNIHTTIPGIVSESDIYRCWDDEEDYEFPLFLRAVLLRLLGNLGFLHSLPNRYCFIPRFLSSRPLPQEYLEEMGIWPQLTATDVEYAREYSMRHVSPSVFCEVLIAHLMNLGWNPVFVSSQGGLFMKPFRTVMLKSYERGLRLFVRGSQSADAVVEVNESILHITEENFHTSTQIEILFGLDAGNKDYLNISLEECEQAVRRGNPFLQRQSKQIRVDRLAPEFTLATIQALRIQHAEEIEKIKKIGEGSFSEVFHARYRGRDVAVKELSSSEDVMNFRKEVWIQSQLTHSSIVGLVGYSMSPPTLVMEWMDCGNLFERIHNQQDKPLSWKDRVHVALCIAKGLAFMHSLLPPIVHRDLKSPNVVLRQEGGLMHAKLTDFGTSIGASVSGLSSKVVDNPVWVAPEIIEQKRYDAGSDVYSLGVIMYELLSRKQYFGELRWRHEIEDAVCTGLRPSLDEHAGPDEFKAAVRDCWSGEVSRRPTAKVLASTLESILATLADWKPALTTHSSVELAKKTRAASTSSSTPSPTNSRKKKAAPFGFRAGRKKSKERLKPMKNPPAASKKSRKKLKTKFDVRDII